jgi:hypothetical protein
MNKTPYRFDCKTENTYHHGKAPGVVTPAGCGLSKYEPYIGTGIPRDRALEPHHHALWLNLPLASSSDHLRVGHKVGAAEASHALGPRRPLRKEAGASPGVSASYDNGEASRPAGPWASSGSSLPFSPARHGNIEEHMSNSLRRLLRAETAGFRVSILSRAHIVTLIVAFIPVVEHALAIWTAEPHVEAEFLHHSQ